MIRTDFRLDAENVYRREGRSESGKSTAEGVRSEMDKYSIVAVRNRRIKNKDVSFSGDLDTYHWNLCVVSASYYRNSSNAQALLDTSKMQSMTGARF